MASPQKENGYTAIANEIIEALVNYRIPGEQMQCLLFILRKTYGFNKKEDCISNSQFVKATGVSRQNVHRAVKGLIDKNLVVKKDYNPHPKYCFNKNYNAWKVYSKKTTVVKKDSKCSQKRGTQKTIQKTLFSEDSYSFKLSTLLYSLILENNNAYKKPNLQDWAKSIDLMIRRDKRFPEDIEAIIKWCQADDFWHTNILSTSKLRKQYDQLMLKMKADEKANYIPVKKLTSVSTEKTWAGMTDIEREESGNGR